MLCGHGEARWELTGRDRLYHTTARAFDVVACGGCGLLRLSPRPLEAELPQYYPQQYWFSGDRSLAGRLEESFRRLLIRDHARFVQRAYRNAGATGPMLDAGCGGGLLAGVLRARGVPAMGLDSSADAVKLAWHRHRVPALQGDLRQAPFAPRSLALLSMFHVVEHLLDPVGYLRAAHALLRDNGRLVVQAPNADCLQFRVLRARWSGIDIPRHVQNFRRADLQRLLSSAGFEITRTKHFSWRDNPAGLATSLWPSLEPVARRVRQLDRGGASRLFKDAAYLVLVLASVPFTVLEAALGRGSTVMVEARKIA